MRNYLAIAAALFLASAAPVAADSPDEHDGGPKAHDGAPGESHDGGNDHRGDEGGTCCGRKTPIGTDENGNPSTDTPGLGPDWDPHRDDVSGPTDEDRATDWGWGEQ